MSIGCDFAEGKGELVSFTRDQLHAIGPVPYAPGTPIRLNVALTEVSIPIEAKCGGSKRREDGRFDLTLRVINMRRLHREAIMAAFEAASG